MPTIEIDDELYAFIESRAGGFDATPNSVLRGLLGLDEPGADTPNSFRDSPQEGKQSARKRGRGGRGGPEFRGPGGPGGPFGNRGGGPWGGRGRGGPGGWDSPGARMRQPRARLDELVKAGILKEGQKLILMDFQGNRVEGAEAVVREGQVHFDGRDCTMSSLAGELLRGCGYKSRAFRGPRHWHTEDGRSIEQLWRQFMSEKSEEKSD
ncbi:MAG: hypothetical protein ACE5FN_03930 [Leptospirillia bacterium]